MNSIFFDRKKDLLNNDSNKAVLSRYFILNINKSLFKNDIKIDIDFKIRNKSREKKIYEYNLKILKELDSNINLIIK